MEMDFEEGVFRAIANKLMDISVFSKNLVCTVAPKTRWVMV